MGEHLYTLNCRKSGLFDLQDDPWETENLADKSRYQATVKQLDKELRRWMKKTGDKLTLPAI